MNSEINLVTGKTFNLEKRIKQARILRIIAIISLVLVSLISIVLFIITITLPISSVKKDQQQTLSSLSILHKKHVSYSLMINRLQEIKNVTTLRKNYSKTLNEILKIVPSSLSVESMTVDTGKIEVQVSGNSLLEINALINSLISLDSSNKYIKNLMIQNLTLNSQSAKVTLDFQADML